MYRRPSRLSWKRHVLDSFKSNLDPPGRLSLASRPRHPVSTSVFRRAPFHGAVQSRASPAYFTSSSISIIPHPSIHQDNRTHQRQRAALRRRTGRSTVGLKVRLRLRISGRYCHLSAQSNLHRFRHLMGHSRDSHVASMMPSTSSWQQRGVSRAGQREARFSSSGLAFAMTAAKARVRMEYCMMSACS